MFETPRGIRNNNPGNIRKTKDQWKGLAAIQNDSSFFVFESAVWGIRALAKILLNYQTHHNLRTVRQMINRWAPPSENNTISYVDHVATAMGVEPDQPIDLCDYDYLYDMVVVIVLHENGEVPYEKSEILLGIGKAREDM